MAPRGGGRRARDLGIGAGDATAPPDVTRRGVAPPLRAPAADVRPDWAAYYRAFHAAHTYRDGGGIVDGGRVLFADGWSCSATDHGGPYSPPPPALADLVPLQARYWRRRRQVVKAERDRLAFTLEGLAEQQRAHALPLQVRVDRVDAETGRLVRDSGDVDWATLTLRLRWLADDVKLCDDELESLGETP